MSATAPANSARLLLLAGHHVEIHDAERWLRTTFPDGATLTAAANGDPESVARAHSLGYDGDTWAMSRDHECIHVLLMTALGHPTSPTLRANAAPPPVGGPDRAWQGTEERFVLAIQRLVRTGRGRAALYPLDVAGADVEGIVRRAGELMAVLGG